MISGWEETQFHTVGCWDGLAETVSAYVKRGDRVYLEGRLQHRSFEDEEGRERVTKEIVASAVQFLGRRQDGTTFRGGPVTRSATEGVSDVSPEEMPF